MTRLQIMLASAAAVISAIVAEAYLGTTRYEINGITYYVPHKYEFLRNVSLPWLARVKGLDKEPDQSVWLLFSANELTQGIVGYKRWFHGYSDEVEADMVVSLVGGREAREFPDDRRNDMAKVAQELAKKSHRKPDAVTGWDRVYWGVGAQGSPGEGYGLFYLIPHSGLSHLPSDWRVPYCYSSPDRAGRETYDCELTIYRGGRTYGFHSGQENFGVANRVPDYVQARLNGWRA